jgi:SAM-dependent methyltransferase
LGGYVIGKPAPGTWCPEIWDWSIEELGVTSALDVGCGLGYVMEYFDQKGVSVAGVDGSPSAIRDSVLPQYTLQHDYAQGEWVPERKYDLIWSSEFLEHVEEAFIPHFMATFQAAEKYIFVTFAVPGQQGHHHVNLQYADYWIEKFMVIGFVYDEALTNYAKSLLPPSGMRSMQFRDKGLIFKKR